MLLWRAWEAYAQRAGIYQTRAVLTLAYLLMLGPCASLGRLFGARLLDLRTGSGGGTWIRRSPQEKSLDALRRQF